MKKGIVLICLLNCFLALDMLAQEPVFKVKPLTKAAFIPAYPVKVGWDHTTALVFPAKVLSVDRGHGKILAKVEEQAPNLLLLKAGKREFVTTNLHVVTADARLYHLRVSYSEALAESSINMVGQAELSHKALVLKNDIVDAEKLMDLGQQVLEAKGFLRRSSKQHSIKVKLEGVFHAEGLLFLKLVIKNKSPLAFEPDELEFVVKDKKQSKHTSIGEQFLEPVWLDWEADKEIDGHEANKLVMAFPSFTISDKKYFQVLVREKNGDRDLSLNIRAKDMQKVRNLTNVQTK
ncbi:conjugative transposon protein TraN [Echinicola shivajiensis]|uniref:conjugative transposon protein TraN n=1 Tax=Echinicola shivajiensis TaxID=1035916 RepID=UPI001BFCC87D|nr:conjugative transposon protein TraN [Echinicola shivajiensis]